MDAFHDRFDISDQLAQLVFACPCPKIPVFLAVVISDIERLLLPILTIYREF